MGRRGGRALAGTIGALLTLGLTLAVAGCVETSAIECADGVVCPAAQACAPAGGGCVEPAQVAACEGRREGEGCALFGIGAGACRAGVCVVTGCGDGVPDAGEACDDGNQVDDDGCTNACTLPVCGDGVRQGAEGCDDGAANADDRACTSACAVARCGDGLLRAGVEACDFGAGNADDGACTLACAAARCGDGLTWLGVETCDDGNTIDDDACRDACALPSCGDGVVQAGEGCDEGAFNGDERACTLACQLARCGDGLLHLGVEGCDVGADNADDAACTSRCAPNVCGDGGAWTGVEACDDGNTADGDGCRGDCEKREACGDAEVDLGEACDDGPAGLANPADGCDACVATAWSAQALVGLERRALEIGLARPAGVAIDLVGNLYIADAEGHQVRKVAAGVGTITTVAGTGSAGSAGDGGAATAAQLASPGGVAVDGAGNVYIADTGNHRVRRVAVATGTITTIAGTGEPGLAGDDGPATSAWLASPTGLAVDGAGNVYIADTDNARVRLLSSGTGLITTVAGGGEGGLGDDGPATQATLMAPTGVALGAAGVFYIADAGDHRVRVVSGLAIYTAAGNGQAGDTGDEGLAIAARLRGPRGVALDAAGNLYIADADNQRVRRVAAADGVITTVAGTSAAGFDGDGGPAIGAAFSSPSGVATGGGALFVADTGNNRVRRVSLATGVVSTVAGMGGFGEVGDGGAATSARLQHPTGVAVDGAGNVYLSEVTGKRVRKVAADSGAITTIAQLDAPGGLATDGAGNLFIGDRGAGVVLRRDAATGLFTTVASGLDPVAMAIAPNTGDLYVAGNGRVDRIAAATGAVTTVMFGANPVGVAVDGANHLYVADNGTFDLDSVDQRVWKVDLGSGAATHFAGAGQVGLGAPGDGGPATLAQFYNLSGLAADAAGNVYITDLENYRIRRVDVATGIITTVVGPGPGHGDGGPALAAGVYFPWAVAFDAEGNYYIADSENHRIRRVSTTGVISTVAGRVHPEGMGAQAQATFADPQALALAPDFTLVAGGVTGTVQALRLTAQRVEMVAGRYPDPAVSDLARFRPSWFGSVGGVAYDAALGRIYLTETTGHRIHAVTVVDPADADTWTIEVLAGDAAEPSGPPGFADGSAGNARFDAPAGLAFDADARVLYIADVGNHVVRVLPIDAFGVPGAVTTIAGRPRTLGFFGDGGAATDALLYRPRAIARCGNGDLFIADADNHRVRRVEAGSGVITSVLGDGQPGSSGQGAPAAGLQVDTPLGLACDAHGNVYVTSRTTVRLLVADAAGVVDGTGPAQTIYGASPRTEYPASVTRCLTGVAVVDADTVYTADSCQGVLVELWRQPVAAP